MTIKLAINGYGRIGRCVLRALYESGYRDRMKIVAVNELSDIGSIAHLTRFDSTHGIFCGKVSHQGRNLLVNQDAIAKSCEQTVEKLAWNAYDVDVVLECTGSFTERRTAEGHLKSGAKKVIFSCPAQPDVDATIVYGINENSLTHKHRIISNASCTTNCIAHVIKILDDHLGVDHGVISTIHSMMNDQPVIDAYHNPDLRRSRSSGNSIIPVNTELAKGIDRVLPGLKGRFEAVALRVPTMNVSLMQLTATVRKKTDAQAVNRLFKEASKGRLDGIFGYNDLPLVSCDFNHDPRSAVVDGSQTNVSGNKLVSVMAWFDNEWGYANRMLDTALALMTASQ